MDKEIKTSNPGDLMNNKLPIKLRWVLSFALAVGLLAGFSSTAEAARTVKTITVGAQVGSTVYGTTTAVTFPLSFATTGGVVLRLR